jgi:hypothetical protein
MAKQEEQVIQNERKQPRKNTKSRKIWEVALSISEEKDRPAQIAEVLAHPDLTDPEAKMNKGTIRTQYSYWRAFWGLPKLSAKSKPAPPVEIAEEIIQTTPEPKSEAIPPPLPPEIVEPATDIEQGENMVPDCGNTAIYDAGWKAYCEGLDRKDCPYIKASSVQAVQWSAGFNAAGNS